MSELVLATLIQRYDKNYFIFDPVQERQTNWNFTGCQTPNFMIVLILCMYLQIEPFLNIFEEYGAFKETETRVKI